MMFLSLLKGEFKKMLKPRSLVILSIVLVIAFILMIVSFSSLGLLSGIIQGEGSEGTLPEGYVPSFQETANAKSIFNEAQANNLLATYRAKLAQLEEVKRSNPSFYYSQADQIYTTKAQIAAVEYIKQNNLYGQDVPLYLGESSGMASAILGNPTGIDFVEFSMSVLGIILAFYMITVAANVLVQELKSGSIKLLMLRPVSRSQVMSAKLAAVAIYGAGLYLLCFLVALFYGGVRYGIKVTPMLYVFNAAAPFLASRGFALFLSFLQGILVIFTFSLLAYTAGNLFRNSGAGICIGIIGATGVLSMVFSAFGGVRFLLSYQTSFVAYFSTGTSLYGGSNYFLSLGILALYWVAMLVANYVVFQKRDII